MANTYTPAGLAKPASGDTGWGTTANANTDRLSGFSAVGALAVVTTEIPSATLRVQVTPGTFLASAGGYVDYAGTAGTPLTLSASATVYLWLTDAGTLTTGAGWPAAGTKHVRLAVVVTGTASVTTVTDKRVNVTSGG